MRERAVNNAPTVLSRRRSSVPGAVWEARISSDRQRLEVVLVVEPSATPLEVPLLSDVELRELLAAAPTQRAEEWRCSECGTVNDASRRWCRNCSDHAGASA